MGHTAQLFDAFVRVWPITYNVAQAPHIFPLSFCIFQDSLKGGKVGMDIGYDENAHTGEPALIQRMMYFAYYHALKW
jgi:hypothetical protein